MELTKETSLFKKDAIKTDVIAAAATATNYIEDVSGSNQTGMTLQPASNSADNYMQLDATEIGIYQSGHKIASYGNIITLYRLVNNNPVKTLEITGTGLQLYGSNIIDADVSLTSAGLVLRKGGIQVGTPGQNGFVYLSTEDYPLKDSNVTPPISGLTINDYTPTAAQTDGRTVNDAPWRQIIGTNFGITSDGILYANGAHITGQITIDGHSQNLSNEMASLQTATNDAATKATNFLTNLTGIDGLVVRKDASSNSDYVNIQANAIRIVTGGTEAFKTWVEDNTTKVRIGLESLYNIILQSDKIRFIKGNVHPNLQEMGRIEYDGINRMNLMRSAMGTDGYTYEAGYRFTYNESSLFYKHNENSTGVYITPETIKLEVIDSNDKLSGSSTYIPSTYINVVSSEGTEQQKIYLESYGQIRCRSRQIYFEPPGKSYYLPDMYCYVYLYSMPSGTTGNYAMVSNDYYLTYGASSSKRYKHDISSIQTESLNPHKLYDIEVVQFVYNDNYIDIKDQRFRKKVPGFIAEDVYKHYPIAVDLKNNRPEDWNHRFIIPPMLKLIQEQHGEIEKLKTKITILEEKIYDLSSN